MALNFFLLLSLPPPFASFAVRFAFVVSQIVIQSCLLGCEKTHAHRSRATGTSSFTRRTNLIEVTWNLAFDSA